MKWSKNQEKAIKSSGGSILLSAAAGSGKTAVVVERIMQKIVDKKSDINIDELLVVTFSNAAAQEIKNRISKKINEALIKDPLNKHLQKQQILLDSTKISTIHSFCQTIIKENFETLYIPVDFKICNEYQSTSLKYQAFTEIIDEYYKYEDFKEILKITDAIYEPKKLFNIIMDIFKFLQSLPFPQDWLLNNLEKYKLDSKGCLKNNEFQKTILINAKYYIEQAKKIIIKLLDLSTGLENEKKFKEFFKNRLEVINKLSEDIKDGLWDNIYVLLQDFNIDILPRFKKETDLETKQEIKILNEHFKEIISILKNDYFIIDQKGFIEDIKYTYKKMVILSELINKFTIKYNGLKIAKNFLDFSDLEHLAIKLLITKRDGHYVKTEIAESISEKFAEIFIDEYQDINLTQEYIFKAISKDETNLFMVGDVKQSIYRFRQAVPQLFIKKNKEYANYDGVTFPAKIILNQNFRSCKSVTEFINFIFKQIMTKEMGEIDYDETQQLIPALEYSNKKDNIPEIIILKTDDKISNKKKLTYEAEYIAKKIKEMVDNKFKITKDNKLVDVTYSDFCILMRSPNEKTVYFKKAFNKLKIPLTTEFNNNLFEAPEIITVISFLKAINNPLEDINIMSIMMSEIYNILPDDILRLKTYDKPTLFQAIKEDIKRSGIKFKKFYKTLCEYKSIANFISIEKLLEKIYKETDYYNIVKSKDGGNNKQVNLDIFKNLAKEYGENGNNSLIDFIYYLNNLSEQKTRLMINKNENEEENSVKMMSIHKAKGLEFGICILADIDRQINKVDIKSPILYHSQIGIGLNKYDKENNIKYTTVIKNAIKLEIEKDMLLEELRIFYVALTRTREKLIIVIFDNNYEKQLEYWNIKMITKCDEKKISPYILKQIKTYEDLIIITIINQIQNNEIMDKKDIPKIKICQEKIEIGEEGKEIEEKKSKNGEKDKKYDKKIIDWLQKQTKMIYPDESLKKIPSKLGVSEIVKNENLIKYSFNKQPKITFKNKLSNIEKGNILHKFMQFANYENAKKNIESECLRLLTQEYISREEYENLDKNRLNQFFKSKLYNMISKAKNVYREYRFIYPLEVEQLGYETKNKDYIIVQGIADCFIENEEEIIIIDYKTDKVSSILELYNKYKYQLTIYQQALSKIFKKPSKTAIIYSFYLNSSYIIKKEL